MSERITFADFSSVSVVELNGARPTARLSPRITSRLSIEGSPSEDHDNSIQMRVVVECREAVEDGEGDLLYSGAAAFLVRHRPDLDISDADMDDVATAIWPAMRAVLEEHAFRLRFAQFQIPISIKTPVDQTV